MRKLKSLKMGNTLADEHTTNFKLLVDCTDLATAGDAILIYFYQLSLPPWLIERIYQGEVPLTLANWKARAILLDHNKRLASAFTGGGRSGGSGGGKKKKFMFRRYPQVSGSQSCDPDAMDVDRLTIEIQCLNFDEQKKLMEKGLCFNCKKPGHFAANCPTKKNPSKAKQNRNGKQKPKARAIFTQIRALVAELSDGEMEEFQQLADNKAFGGEEGSTVWGEEDQDF